MQTQSTMTSVAQRVSAWLAFHTLAKLIHSLARYGAKSERRPAISLARALLVCIALVAYSIPGRSQSTQAADYLFNDTHFHLTNYIRLDPMITGFNPTDMYAAGHIRRVLRAFPGVFTGIGEFSIHKEFVSAKISGEVARYIVATPEWKNAATIANRYPDRFLFGTDEVAPPNQEKYLKVYNQYEPFWKQLAPEASRKIRKNNYERIFDEARRRVRSWEAANVKS